MGELILKRPWVAIGIIVLISTILSTIANRPYIEYCAKENVESKMDTIVIELKNISKSISNE